MEFRPKRSLSSGASAVLIVENNDKKVKHGILYRAICYVSVKWKSEKMMMMLIAMTTP